MLRTHAREVVCLMLRTHAREVVCLMLRTHAREVVCLMLLTHAREVVGVKSPIRRTSLHQWFVSLYHTQARWWV
jgi:hypothetical protein